MKGPGFLATTRRISGETWSATPYSNVTSRTKGIIGARTLRCGGGNVPGGPPMALDALYFVSKRLQAVAAALLCLAFVQLVTAASEPPPPMSVRVAITR